MRLWLCVVLLLAGCRSASNNDRQADAALAGFGVPLTAGDVAAYQRGRQREIDTLRSPGPVTPTGLDSLGAAATGLPVEDYRGLVASVEHYLKDWSSNRGIHPLNSKLDSALAFLDSLRVERMVLAVRVGQ